ncbi:MAG TPA: hypothetical protein VH988_10805 [Thermoanaerobaculia bacterium]|nr:hypothetical protein [Thermoanaerobaculia bacterium]
MLAPTGSQLPDGSYRLGGRSAGVVTCVLRFWSSKLPSSPEVS